MPALLMGGQACVFYGAAEFSRDLDLLIPSGPGLETTRAWLGELQAEPIAVPPFGAEYLERGHAVHFRCHAGGVEGLRIDLMSVLRGVDPFGRLWERRTAIEAEGVITDLLSLADLVAAKKTQRDKDWPMIRRLLEQSYWTGQGSAGFWLRELRTPELLLQLAGDDVDEARRVAEQRPAVAAALRGDVEAVAAALAEEERRERELDREYWAPRKRELEQLRHRPGPSQV